MRRSIISLAILCAFIGTAAGQAKVRRFKGETLNDTIIDSLSLNNKMILITDFMGEINNNFTPEETHRSLRGPYYTKFNLRDSKMRCIISKYDTRDFDRMLKINKNDRVTVIRLIYQLAMGIKRFSNPYYILRVIHIEGGWRLEEEQDILRGFEKSSGYEEVSPHDINAKAEEYAGEYVQFKDRFSLVSTMFTSFERDMNLNNKRALKFYVENCTTPCYMPNTEVNKQALATLKSGDKITVSGRLNLCPFEDDALLLFSINNMKLGW